MLGPRFDRIPLKWKGLTIAHGYYFFFGFYWFCFCFFKKWPLHFMDGYVTGFSFAYKPNSKATYGDLMWLNDRRYLRIEHPGDIFHAKKI
jgi:hypothetical protein